MKTVRVVGGCDCGGKVILDVEALSPRGVIDRRMLTADVDAGLGPNSIPAGVAQGFLLIPVSSSELGVVCGGVERNDGNGSDTSKSGL